jgi:hypothetical protein
MNLVLFLQVCIDCINHLHKLIVKLSYGSLTVHQNILTLMLLEVMLSALQLSMFHYVEGTG